jgi:hypothetical protein
MGNVGANGKSKAKSGIDPKRIEKVRTVFQNIIHAPECYRFFQSFEHFFVRKIEILLLNYFIAIPKK